MAIPDFRAYLKSNPWDSADCPVPEWIDRMRQEIRSDLHKRKREFTRWIRGGLVSKNVLCKYKAGPIDLSLGMFVSSRWHERRLQLPLAKNLETWAIAWLFWRGARSYCAIKKHIEKYGMRKPIQAEWFVNYDPSKMIHQCYSYQMRNNDWPFLILRTGNERLLMAMFEWGRKTIPVTLWVLDGGYSKTFSIILKHWMDTQLPDWLKRRHRCNVKANKE